MAQASLPHGFCKVFLSALGYRFSSSQVVLFIGYVLLLQACLCKVSLTPLRFCLESEMSKEKKMVAGILLALFVTAPLLPHAPALQPLIK